MTDHIDTAAERGKLAAMEGHTPGPWRQGQNNPDRVSKGGEYIANCNPTHQTHPRTESNARLIAAAPDLLATNRRLLDALDAERARAEKAEAERDQALARLAHESDEALAKVAAAFDASAEACEPFYYDGVGDRMCKVQCRNRIQDLTPADAQAALDKLLAEARAEGWRAGRDAATEPLTALAAVLRKSENSYHQSQASAMLERADAIRALPEPKEASHE